MASSSSIIGISNVKTILVRMILTEFIFRQVQEYLDHNKTDINNISNVSREFQEIKRSNFYWKLNKGRSLAYCNDGTFKSRLDSLLSNTGLQLSLNLNSCGMNSDISALGNVNTLDISCCSEICDVSALGNVWCDHEYHSYNNVVLVKLVRS